jgi:hypothetical protein
MEWIQLSLSRGAQVSLRRCGAFFLSAGFDLSQLLPAAAAP